MITQEEVTQYLSIVGKRGLNTLKAIETLRPFVEMMQTDMGREFLRDDIEAHSLLINRIYEGLIKEGKAEQSDVIKLQLMHGRLQHVYDRLKYYTESVKSVKNPATTPRRE